MANYEQLRNIIEQNIRENGTQLITGEVMQNSLLAMINSLGEHATFAGVANTSTDPGSPDGPVFYFAGGAGTYDDFGGLTVSDNEIAIFLWAESWAKLTVTKAKWPTVVEDPITFKEQILLTKGFRTPNFASGQTGTGAQVDGDGNAELKSLAVREFIETPVLNYNRVDISVGDNWSAPGGGIIESVDTTQMTGTLKLEDGEIGAIKEGDFCMGIFHSENMPDNATQDTDDSTGNIAFAGFATVYFQITEVTGDHNENFKYTLRPTSSSYPKQLHPFEAMKFVAYGSSTDASRRSSVYATRTYQRYLRNVNNWTYGIDNIAAQFGDLSNLSVFGLQMEGYSAYLDNIYMQGLLQSLDKTFVVDSKTKSLLLASSATGMGLAFNPEAGLTIGKVYDPETGSFKTEYDIDKIQSTAQEGVDTAKDALQKAQGAQDYIDNTLPNQFAEINRKLDGVVENWFKPYSPTLENEPAATWIKNGEEKIHEGDTFTNTQSYVDSETTPDAGKSWRWVLTDGVWGWTPIADSDAVKALLQAAKAQETADGKIRNFVTQPTTPYSVGDIWTQGTEGGILKCIKSRDSGDFVMSDWAPAADWTNDDTAIKAQQTANEAREEAKKNTEKLTKWSSDSYISPTEKTGLKQQQANIRSEYNQILFEAQRYSVSTVLYETAYTKADEALTKYTASSPEEIPVESDYANIAAYYSDRQSVLDAISAKVKAQMDAAAQAAANAQKAAEAAQKDATANKELLTKWSSDSYISPTEKTALKQQQADIQAEYTEIVSQAGLYGISISNYSTAYSKAMSAFTKYTAASPSEIAIGTDYANIAAYYTARQTILNNIAAAAKSLVDSVDTAVSNLEYLKTVFAKDETVIAGGAVIGSFVGVKNDAGSVVAGLAGKDFLTKSGAATFAADLTCPMFFAGATSATAANSAAYRVYADGSAFANKLTLQEGCVVGGLKITKTYLQAYANEYLGLGLYYTGLIDARRVGNGSQIGITYFGNTDGSLSQTTDGKYAGLAMFSSGNTTLAGILIAMEDSAPAMEIRGGYVRGLRRYSKYNRSTTVYVDKLDDIIISAAPAATTIYLPNDAPNGWEFELWQASNAMITINGRGIYIKTAGSGQLISSLQLAQGSYSAVKIKYCKELSNWLLVNMK